MIRNSVRAGLFMAAQRAWAAAFQLLGWIWRPAATLWTANGGQRILVVAPHPDDETIGCGGTVVLHLRAGDHVVLGIVTDGRRSRALALTGEQMARRRRQEAAAAAEILGGAEVVWCGLPEGNWQMAEAEEVLLDLLESVRPDILYAPSRIDFHPEHFEVAHATALALQRYGRELTVRIYPIQVPLTAALTNLVADTSSVADTLAAALKAYETQYESLLGSMRSQGYAARQFGFRRNGEVFWQIPPEAYAWLHGESPNRWENAFRGLRPRPFGDPLAYLAGRRLRRSFRAEIAHRFGQNTK